MLIFLFLNRLIFSGGDMSKMLKELSTNGAEYLLLIIMSIFVSSCSNDCDNKCKLWEHCNIDKDICELKNGACEKTKDCLHSDDVCIKNVCIERTECKEWEVYIEDTNSCNLSVGSCNSNIECINDDKPICNIEEHICEEKFNVVFKKDCPSYLSSNAECAMVKLPLNYNDLDG